MKKNKVYKSYSFILTKLRVNMHRFFKNKAYIYKPLLLLGYMSCLGFPFTKAYTETTPQPSKNTINSSRHMTSVQDLSLIGPLCDGSYSSSLST